MPAWIVVLFAVLIVGGCKSPSPSSPSAQAIIDSAVVAHGGTTLDRATVSFTFRDAHIDLRRYDGRFHYRHQYTDSLNRPVQDGLTNQGPYRVVAGDTVSLSDDARTAVQTRVNSVAYFALLPYPLQDPAVQPTYDGRDTLAGTTYHRIRVTFRKKGGGSDWEDVFLYWFQTDTYALDFLAYAFGLGSGDTDRGTRFREAYNVRRVNEVRFADYRNYTADSLSPAEMARYPDLWQQDALSLVSRIELDSIRVRPLATAP